jgi:heme-degrading monooxygenase HmoA
MFARVNSVETTPDKLAGLVKFCEEGLPAFREASGFEGFYLLADRESGKVVTISLWGSADDLRQLEARAARARKEASADVGIDSPPEDIYEVILHA